VAKSGGPNFIDGFSSVQAVKRSKNSGKARTHSSGDKLPALKKPEPVKDEGSKSAAKRISRSIIPEKFSITCYECKYVFTLQGRVIDNFCPKCHEKLLAKDVVIDKEWSDDVKTIGRVEIKKGASFKKQCRIVTRDLLLAADASDADLTVHNKLELSRGAGFNVKATTIHSLLIVKGSSLAMKGRIECESMEVLGTFTGTIAASKTVTIEKGGSFKGSLEAPGLVVRDGAALNAKLKIGEGRK